MAWRTRLATLPTGCGAPGASGWPTPPGPAPDAYGDVPVLRARSFRTPGYKEYPVGLPDPSIERAMADFKPDLVRLASPFIIGAYGLRAARELGVPTGGIF